MAHEDKTTAGSGISEDVIILREIKVAKDTVFLYFNKSDFNIWLENTNKHIPEVYQLKREGSKGFSFSCSQLPEDFTRTSLKLSISNDTNKLNYLLQGDFFDSVESENSDIFLEEYKGNLVLVIKNNNRSLWNEKIDLSCLRCASNGGFEKANNKSVPVKIGVIGTCFSRSVFRSDDFFNPGYKRFFTVPLTFFHNSLISLMSKRFDDSDFLLTRDLLSDQVFRYIEIEFLKNIKERISSAGVEYLIIDNYSDATLEAIEMDDDCILTYNKYFSESIYKRKFSGKNKFIPGELKHIDKYREAVKKFYLILQELNLDKRVILVGGRLSTFKTQSELWQSKMNWIKRTNRNWDMYDAIFLEELPDAQYIDMRSTNWISDVNSPIIGGASPSHYQSGFYKEIYEKIIKIILKG